MKKRQSRYLALFVDEKFFTNAKKCINILARVNSKIKIKQEEKNKTI